jgi:hypothetical protein
MYTQVFIETSLKEDTPNEVITTLENMISDMSTYWQKPYGRLNWCFHSSSYYFNNIHFAYLKKDEIDDEYKLCVLCDFKNYENEIEEFIKWLEPHIANEGMFGYIRYEEDDKPTILYKEGGKL